jgi:hypothetical protein
MQLFIKIIGVHLKPTCLMILHIDLCTNPQEHSKILSTWVFKSMS